MKNSGKSSIGGDAPKRFDNRPAMKRNKPDMASRSPGSATQTPETGVKGEGKPAKLPD